MVEIRRSPLGTDLFRLIQRQAEIAAAIAAGREGDISAAAGDRPAEIINQAIDETNGIARVNLIALPGRVEELERGLVALRAVVTSRGPRVILARVPLDKLAELGQLPGLASADIPQPLLPQLDAACGPATNATAFFQQQPNIRGCGVVVGIVDTGIDWRHPDFKKPDGTTRIELLVDIVATGQSVSYTADQINAALLTGGSLVPCDLVGHGTHCASIAAGNGSASGSLYRGIAPDATLVVVRTHTFLEDDLADGIRKIFAQAGTRPAVVSLSSGSHRGAHDGTTTLETTISDETGPGRIVVVAAGNDANRGNHFQGTLVEGEDLDIDFIYRESWQTIDVWLHRDDEVTASFIDPIGVEDSTEGKRTSGPVNLQIEIDFHEDASTSAFSKKLSVTLSHWGQQAAVGRGCRIRLHAVKVCHGTVDAWAYSPNIMPARDVFARSEFSAFGSSPSQACTVTIPATEQRAIAVGSFITRDGVLPGKPPEAGVALGAVSAFSGRGPARSGELRPDVVAPGQYVLAALADKMSEDCGMLPSPAPTIRLPMLATELSFGEHLLPGNRYVSLSGTSMAAPFVAGVVALMLEREPNLTPEHVQERLHATAQRPAAGPDWDPALGYGAIDVQALMNYPVQILAGPCDVHCP